MSTLNTSRPACSDRSEFSSNPENQEEREKQFHVISIKKHSYVLKDPSYFIHKPDEAEWLQMTCPVEHPN
jgi:hypothetical protein